MDDQENHMKMPRNLVIALLFLFAIVHQSAASQTRASLAISGSSQGDAASIRISTVQALTVGRRIWKNECDGTIAGLTSWNGGESFPSLGIGHFIWYPQNVREPFQESFPGLIAHFSTCGVAVPAWLVEARFCPWATRKEFVAARNSVRMRELRRLLASTISIQAEFIARRLAASLPVMTAKLSDAERKIVSDRFFALFQTPDGLYALMDYINFKGEGIKESERYAGQGWGLLQVLQTMTGLPRGADAVKSFAGSAAQVLERRVANAPTGKRTWENSILPGWKKRVRSYVPSSAP